jgi:hypothetical protein
MSYVTLRNKFSSIKELLFLAKMQKLMNDLSSNILKDS